jgi:S1-C subfamily serine protease
MGALLPNAIAQAQEGEPLEANTKTHSGTLLSISENSLTLTPDGEKEQTHAIVRDATISLNGQPASADDLRKGDQLRVVTPPDGKSALAIEAVRVEPRTAAIGPRAIVAQVAPPAVDEATAPEAPRPETSAPPQEPAKNEPQPPSETAPADESPRLKNDAQDGKRGMLGVYVGPSEFNAPGLRVIEVMSDGPAAKAGIRPGDLLLTVNGQQLENPPQLGQFVGDLAAGERVELTVAREGQRFKTSATLGEAEDLQEDAQVRGFRGEGAAANGDADQAWLGVIVDEQARGEKDLPGAIVRRVYPSSPAWRAGIRDDDRITSVDTQRVSNSNELFAALDDHQPNDAVKLVITREGLAEPVTLEATLGRRGDFFDNSDRQGSQDNSDPIFGIPETTMRMEYERRLEEHDERIEGLVLQVLKEVRELRQEVDALKASAPAPRAATE